MKIEKRLYKIKPEFIDWDNGDKYCWAKPAYSGMLGLDRYVADFWIVSKSGSVHPGYNVSPVPIQERYLEVEEDGS